MGTQTHLHVDGLGIGVSCQTSGDGAVTSSEQEGFADVCNKIRAKPSSNTPQHSASNRQHTLHQVFRLPLELRMEMLDESQILGQPIGRHVRQACGGCGQTSDRQLYHHCTIACHLSRQPRSLSSPPPHPKVEAVVQHGVRASPPLISLDCVSRYFFIRAGDAPSEVEVNTSKYAVYCGDRIG